MELSFKFFHHKEFSIYATINIFIPLIIFLLFRLELTPTVLIFMSLLAMMNGDLLPKLIFTGFLNLLVFNNEVIWITRSILFTISILLIHYIPYKNTLHLFIYNNQLLSKFIWFPIFIWMSYILYLIFKPFYSKYLKN